MIFFKNSIRREADRVVRHQNEFLSIIQSAMNDGRLNRRLLLEAYLQLRKQIGIVTIPARQCRHTIRRFMQNLLKGF